MPDTATLLINCPDARGIVAAVSDFLYKNDANIVHNDQHLDAEKGLFFTRIEWELPDFKLSLEQFPTAFRGIAERFAMQWRASCSSSRPRIAIFVSKYDH